MGDANAAIYCRISEDREGAGLGVERQEDDDRRLAVQLGLPVFAVYVDNDMSAYRRSTRKPRKGYDQMLADAAAGRFSTIITWHTDRLHRSNVELEHYIDVCQPRGIPTHTVKAGQLDLSTAAGRMVARMLGAQARYQVEHMGEQIQRAKEQRVMSGKNAGGPRPFGFLTDGLTVREDEAQEIIRAVQQVIDGISLSAMCRDLNRRGFRTTPGNEWTPSKLRSMLLRPRNAGILIYQGKEAGRAAWPAIVPELTWRQMRAILADPARRTAASNRVSSLGSGLYQCGLCEAKLKLSASGTGSKVRSYRCPAYNHLTQAAVPLDAFVERLIVRKLSEPQTYAALTAPRPDSTVSAQAEIAAADSRLGELGKMFAAGEIDARTMKTATEDLRAKKAAAEQRIGLAAAPRPALLMAGGGAIADVTARWRAADLSARRAVLALLLTVTVNPAPRRGGRFYPGRVEWDWRD